MRVQIQLPVEAPILAGLLRDMILRHNDEESIPEVTLATTGWLEITISE